MCRTLGFPSGFGSHWVAPAVLDAGAGAATCLQVGSERMQVFGHRALSEPGFCCEVAIAGPTESIRERLSHALDGESNLVRTLDSCDALFASRYALDVIAIEGSALGREIATTLLRLHARWRSSIVVVLAVNSEGMATDLLSLGADDAIPVTASWDHTVARVKAATRRARARNASYRRRLGDIIYSREDGRLLCGRGEIRLPPRELDVFDCLWWHAGEVVSPDVIHEHAWRTREASSSTRRNRVEVYICSIRQRLSASKSVSIETVRGRGYRLALRTPDPATIPTTTARQAASAESF
jgi:DNA-binding response OmpR family regulator